MARKVGGYLLTARMILAATNEWKDIMLLPIVDSKIFISSTRY